MNIDKFEGKMKKIIALAHRAKQLEIDNGILTASIEQQRDINIKLIGALMNVRDKTSKEWFDALVTADVRSILPV